MSAEEVYDVAAAEDNLYGACDLCGDRYVLGSEDHCGECGTCWRHCECVGTGAPRNTGTLGAHVGTPALGRVCTGTWVGNALVHDNEPCHYHEAVDAPQSGAGTGVLFILTNAPAAYDYRHTHDTGRTEMRYRAECRLVIVAEPLARQQIDRYLSGAYVGEVW